MRFYLSGGMEFKADLGVAWRDWLTAELAKLGHSSIDPTKIEEDENITGPVQKYLIQMKMEGKLDEVRRIARQSLFRKDMFAIQLADATVVLYDESAQRGAGTTSEAWESFREGRPIYMITRLPLEKMSTWLIGETTQVFLDFEDFLTYAKDHEQLSIDALRAKQIRDEVLGGIYSAS